MSHAAVQSPLAARAARAAQGPPARARRQVDLAPRPDLRRAGGRRDPDFRPARRRGRAQHRQGHAGARARRSSAPARAHGAFMASASAGFREPRGGARFRQFRHRLPADHGGGGRLPDHRDLRRRRLAAQAADAAHPRPGDLHGRPRRSTRPRAGGCRSRSKARATRSRSSTARRCPRRRSSRRCCSRPGGAGRDHRDRERSEPRPHRAAARAFRRRRHASTPDGAHGRRITLKGEPELRAAAGGGAGRPVLGRLPDGGGADRAGLRGHPRPTS